jgi:WD40 repeat protein
MAIPMLLKVAKCRLSFGPDSKFLATGGGDGWIQVWNITDHVKVARFTCHISYKDWLGRRTTQPFSVQALAFSSDSNKLVAGSKGFLEAWDWKRGHMTSASMESYPLSNSDWSFYGWPARQSSSRTPP